MQQEARREERDDLHMKGVTFAEAQCRIAREKENGAKERGGGPGIDRGDAQEHEGHMVAPRAGQGRAPAKWRR